VTSYWTPWAQLPDGIAERVRLTVTGDRFSAVRAGVDPHPDDRRLSGVLLPGFANAHCHAFHRALRGRTHADGGTFWTWREQMYAVASRLDPDRYHALARAVYTEMVLSGITAVGEFHYLHHDHRGRRYTDPNAMSAALAAAATEAGLRLTLLDTCYLSGGLSTGGHLPLGPVQQRFSDGDVDGWAARLASWAVPDGVVAGSAIHSTRAVPERQLARFAEVVPSGPVHVHLSEQTGENAAVQGFYGCSPTELLAHHGLLDNRTTAVHATHLTTTDVELLGRARSYACFCPTTESDLADGIGPAQKLRAAGATITLGSDQNAVIDMFTEMRDLEMHQRLISHDRGRFSPDELMAAATSDGHRSLGRPDCGRLRAGALADFVEVDAGSPRTVGSRPDQIAYAATASDVRTVVIGGRPVVQDGAHRLGPVGRLLADALGDLAEALDDAGGRP
jgi:formiminoglutamate deiminase